MFNHHFFEGQVRPLPRCYTCEGRPRCCTCEAQVLHLCSAAALQASRTLLQTFLEESGGRRAVVVADPPFGGLVKPLANTFSLLSHMWRQAQNAGGCFGPAPFPLRAADP